MIKRTFNTPVPDIWEIQLHTFKNKKAFNDDPMRAWKVLKKLYDTILVDDLYWHFLWEDEFTVLRVDGLQHGDRVCKLLTKMGVYWTRPNNGMWNTDSQWATAQYQRLFTRMFHDFSVLTMEMDIDSFYELDSVSDRIFHCFVNMQFYRFAKMGLRMPEAEANFMGQYTVRRAMWVGKYRAYRDSTGKNQRSLSK